MWVVTDPAPLPRWWTDLNSPLLPSRVRDDDDVEVERASLSLSRTDSAFLGFLCDCSFLYVVIPSAKSVVYSARMLYMKKKWRRSDKIFLFLARSSASIDRFKDCVEEENEQQFQAHIPQCSAVSIQFLFLRYARSIIIP